MIGCGGAGKTTLARALARRLGLPVVHIDDHYWHGRPGTGRGDLTYEQWSRVHEELVADDRWVIDGMKLGTLDARLAAADTVVFLDLPTWQCLRGVLERRLRSRRTAPTEPGSYDAISFAFLRWIWRFRRTVRPLVLEKLEHCSCEIVVLRRRADARAFLDSLDEALVA